jgi:photosystem II stability/assembly factor-like uncharacterized protein
LDNNNLIASGRNVSIYKSNNRGATWQKVNSSGLSPNTWLKSLHFSNINQGWGIDYYGGFIFKTSDGGITWVQQRAGNVNEVLRDIHFIDNNKGYAIGGFGLFIETIDGGNNWSVRNIGNSSTFFESITFSDINNGWITGSGGIILKTSDGGQTWIAQTSTTTLPISKSFFINSSTGWAVTNNFGGNNQVLKTTNGGITWNLISTISNRTLEDVIFLNQNEGYITGIFGYIGKTIDGGNTWIDVNPSARTLTTLRSIAVNSQGVGVIVGDNNSIFRFNPNVCTFTTNQVTIDDTNNSGISLSGNTTVSPFTFKSNQSIISTQAITDGYNIQYKAQNFTELQPGFDVKPQTFFNVERGGCNN